MTPEIPEIAGAVELVLSGDAQAFLVVQIEGEAVRVLELRDEVDVYIGSHARLRRRGQAIELEALPGRLGTYIDGERVLGLRPLAAGNALEIGPISAVVGMAHARYPRRQTIDSIITGTLAPRVAPLIATEPPLRPTPVPLGDMRTQLGEIERATIIAALDAAGGNQTQAARTLGMSRRTLIYRMEKYGLKPAPRRPGDPED